MLAPSSRTPSSSSTATTIPATRRSARLSFQVSPPPMRLCASYPIGRLCAYATATLWAYALATLSAVYGPRRGALSVSAHARYAGAGGRERERGR
eukprot:2198886-Rhodomonas_salina.1